MSNEVTDSVDVKVDSTASINRDSRRIDDAVDSEDELEFEDAQGDQGLEFDDVSTGSQSVPITSQNLNPNNIPSETDLHVAYQSQPSSVEQDDSQIPNIEFTQDSQTSEPSQDTTVIKNYNAGDQQFESSEWDDSTQNKSRLVKAIFSENDSSQDVTSTQLTNPSVFCEDSLSNAPLEPYVEQEGVNVIGETQADSQLGELDSTPVSGTSYGKMPSSYQSNDDTLTDSAFQRLMNKSNESQSSTMDTTVSQESSPSVFMVGEAYGIFTGGTYSPTNDSNTLTGGQIPNNSQTNFIADKESLGGKVFEVMDHVDDIDNILSDLSELANTDSLPDVSTSGANVHQFPDNCVMHNSDNHNTGESMGDDGDDDEHMHCENLDKSKIKKQRYGAVKSRNRNGDDSAEESEYVAYNGRSKSRSRSRSRSPAKRDNEDDSDTPRISIRKNATNTNNDQTHTDVNQSPNLLDVEEGEIVSDITTFQPPNLAVSSATSTSATNASTTSTSLPTELNIVVPTFTESGTTPPLFNESVITPSSTTTPDVTSPSITAPDVISPSITAPDAISPFSNTPVVITSTTSPSVVNSEMSKLTPETPITQFCDADPVVGDPSLTVSEPSDVRMSGDHSLDNCKRPLDSDAEENDVDSKIRKINERDDDESKLVKRSHSHTSMITEQSSVIREEPIVSTQPSRANQQQLPTFQQSSATPSQSDTRVVPSPPTPQQQHASSQSSNRHSSTNSQSSSKMDQSPSMHSEQQLDASILPSPTLDQQLPSTSDRQPLMSEQQKSISSKGQSVLENMSSTQTLINTKLQSTGPIPELSNEQPADVEMEGSPVRNTDNNNCDICKDNLNCIRRFARKGVGELTGGTISTDNVKNGVRSTLWHVQLYEEQLQAIYTIFKSETQNYANHCDGNVFGELLKALDNMVHAEKMDNTPYNIFRNRINNRTNDEHRGTVINRVAATRGYGGRYDQYAESISVCESIKKDVQNYVDYTVEKGTSAQRSKRIDYNYIGTLAMNCFKYQVEYINLLLHSHSYNSVVMDAVIERIDKCDVVDKWRMFKDTHNKMDGRCNRIESAMSATGKTLSNLPVFQLSNSVSTTMLPGDITVNVQKTKLDHSYYASVKNKSSKSSPDDYKSRCERLQSEIEQLNRESSFCKLQHQAATQTLNQQRAFDAKEHKAVSDRLKEEVARNKNLTKQIDAANDKIRGLDKQITYITVNRDNLKGLYEEAKSHLSKLEGRYDILNKQQGGGNGKCGNGKCGGGGCGGGTNITDIAKLIEVVRAEHRSDKNSSLDMGKLMEAIISIVQSNNKSKDRDVPKSQHDNNSSNNNELLKYIMTTQQQSQDSMMKMMTTFMTMKQSNETDRYRRHDDSELDVLHKFKKLESLDLTNARTVQDMLKTNTNSSNECAKLQFSYNVEAGTTLVPVQLTSANPEYKRLFLEAWETRVTSSESFWLINKQRDVLEYAKHVIDNIDTFKTYIRVIKPILEKRVKLCASTGCVDKFLFQTGPKFALRCITIPNYRCPTQFDETTSGSICRFFILRPLNATNSVIVDTLQYMSLTNKFPSDACYCEYVNTVFHGTYSGTLTADGSSTMRSLGFNMYDIIPDSHMREIGKASTGMFETTGPVITFKLVEDTIQRRSIVASVLDSCGFVSSHIPSNMNINMLVNSINTILSDAASSRDTNHTATIVKVSRIFLELLEREIDNVETIAFRVKTTNRYKLDVSVEDIYTAYTIVCADESIHHIKDKCLSCVAHIFGIDVERIVDFANDRCPHSMEAEYDS